MTSNNQNPIPLSLITVCVDCQSALQPHQNHFECISCKRIYNCNDHGVWDFRPRQDKHDLPSIYNESEYKRWLNIFSEKESKDWIIYRNGIFRYFAQAGHRILGSTICSKVKPNELILELGAGTGALLNYVPVQNVVAVDSSLESLVTLKTRWPAATVICGDITTLPFKKGAFDYVVSLHTLEHLYFIAESLEEIIRVMKPNGEMQYVIPTEGGLSFWLGRLLLTGPHLKKKYQLDVKYVMDREHINDANRVLKFLSLYFKKVKSGYWPIPFLRLLSCNAMIYGVCKLPRVQESTNEKAN